MNALRIALCDLRRLSKDWQATLWLLLMPLGFAWIFGSAMRGGGEQATWLPVINLDRHELAGLFVEQLREEGCWVDVKPATAQSELVAKWPYGIVIPAEFGQSVLEGRPVTVSLVKGEGSPERILEIQSRLAQAVVRFTKGLILAGLKGREWNETSSAALKEALAKPQLLTVVRGSHRTLRPPPTGFSQSLPGMLVMFVLQMVLTYGGATLVKDRAGGHFSRLLAAPVTRAEVYGGKVLARVLLASVQAVVLLGAGSVLMRLPLGDHPVYLAPVALALAIFAGCLSILAGLLCETEKQVVLVAIFGSMFLSALGGCWWPIEIVPDLFQNIAMATPSYWAMHGLQSVLYFGRSYEVLTLECPVLLGFAALAGGLAMLVQRVKS